MSSWEIREENGGLREDMRMRRTCGVNKETIRNTVSGEVRYTSSWPHLRKIKKIIRIHSVYDRAMFVYELQKPSWNNVILNLIFTRFSFLSFILKTTIVNSVRDFSYCQTSQIKKKKISKKSRYVEHVDTLRYTCRCKRVCWFPGTNNIRRVNMHCYFFQIQSHIIVNPWYVLSYTLHLFYIPWTAHGVSWFRHSPPPATLLSYDQTRPWRSWSVWKHYIVYRHYGL